MSLFDSALPDNCAWSTVGDFFTITKKPRNVMIHGDVNFVSMDSVPLNGSFEPRYELRDSKNISSGTYFEKGDLLLAKITPSFENGKQALTLNMDSAYGLATTEVIPLKPISDETDIRLLFFYLLHPEVRAYLAERMEGTTGRSRIPEAVLRALPYPELKNGKQKKIADTLLAIVALASLETRSDLLARQLKHATMHKLFTCGLRDEAQKETEIGLVPESWKVCPLDEVAFVQTGVAKGRKLKSEENIEVPYLRVANVQDGRLDLSEIKTILIRSSELSRYLLQEGDVLLTEGGDFDKLGRGFIWRGEIAYCIHQNHVFAVRVDRDKLLPEFFAYLAQSPYGKAYFLKVAHKTTNLACINTTKLKAFPVTFPSSTEQQEIVDILEAIDQKIDLHRRKKAVLEELFKSLLHKLMTGEIRVDDLDLSALEDMQPEDQGGAA